MKRISTTPPSLRPREKILKYGPGALSMTELLALVINSGNKNIPVSTLAGRVSKIWGNDEQISISNLHKMGFGEAKAAQIMAVKEIARRQSPKSTQTITSAKQAFPHAIEIQNKDKEMLMCIFLNARGELIKKEIIAVGTINRALLLPREIFSIIKDLPVASIILAHNHPSGSLEASDDDIAFTKRVKDAGEILGVKLLDHLIVSKNGWKVIGGL